MPKHFFSSIIKLQTPTYPKIKKGGILNINIGGKEDKYKITRKYSKKFIGDTFTTNIYLERV